MIHSMQSYFSSSYANELESQAYSDSYRRIINNVTYKNLQIQQIAPPSAPFNLMRTVYLTNLPQNTQISDIIDYVKTGAIQTIRPLSEKNGIFITFVEASSASQFLYWAQRTRLTISGVELRVGWGKLDTMSPMIQKCVDQGASRNVYLGNLDESITEQVLQKDLSQFGHIEHIKIIPEKRMAFVHFLSISNAVKCITNLPTQPKWHRKPIHYGKDRCDHSALNDQKTFAFPPNYPAPYYSSPNNFVDNNTHLNSNSSFSSVVSPSMIIRPNMAINPNISIGYSTNAKYTFSAGASPTSSMGGVYLDKTYSQSSVIANSPELCSSALTSKNCSRCKNIKLHSTNVERVRSNSSYGLANRTIYFGNVHPATVAQDICNVIHTGALSDVRLLHDRQIAFVTFVEPQAAVDFMDSTTESLPLIIKNHLLKVRWGKQSALPPYVARAVKEGASRSVSLSNLNNVMTEEKIKQEFSVYGEIESINVLSEYSKAFVHFTSIAAAMRAVEGAFSKEEYLSCQISYIKDRCNNSLEFQQKDETVSFNENDLENNNEDTVPDFQFATIANETSNFSELSTKDLVDNPTEKNG